jgi:outer membrane lipoprotein-sorting protein
VLSGAKAHHGQMSIFDRRPRLRWAVPAAAGALILVGTLAGTVAASADAGLPPLTAAELLVAVQSPEATAISGTVVTSADLGLPELPMGTAAKADMTSLVSGSHTLRVWSDGATKSRLAIMGGAAETDIVRNGQDVWMWSSDASTADHFVMPPPDSSKAAPALPAGVNLPSTPQEAADMALASIDQTTAVSTSGVAKVAGRPVYELVLTPKQGDTLVARVAIAVDAQTHVPLRVQVFSTQVQDPAFEVGFTDVDFSTPDASLFDFTPPPGATVTEHTASEHATKPGDARAMQPDAERPTVVGTGWSQVVVAKVPTDVGAADQTGAQDGPMAARGQALAMLQALPTTTGPWGSGRVINGTLFTAILTDDGRLAIGAVGPKTVGAALAAQ